MQRMKRAEKMRFIALHSFGNFLVLLGLYGVIVTFGPVVTYEVQYRIIQVRNIQFKIVDDKSMLRTSTAEVVNNQVVIKESNKPKSSPSFADILAGDTQQVLMPKDPLFSILIPKIGVSDRVFANVDPQDEGNFNAILSRGVAHAKGTVFPGHSGNIYLFAHSAANWWDAGRYNAIFYTLNHLEEKDEIAIFFENKRFTYIVTKKEILEASNTTYLNAPHTGKEQLVLQTCWPPGTTWKRLYIVAERKQSNI